MSQESRAQNMTERRIRELRDHLSNWGPFLDELSTQLDTLCQAAAQDRHSLHQEASATQMALRDFEDHLQHLLAKYQELQSRQ